MKRNTKKNINSIKNNPKPKNNEKIKDNENVKVSKLEKTVSRKGKRKLVFITITMLLLSYIFSYQYVIREQSVRVSNSITKKINPIGRLVGLKLYTKGVLVIGMSEIDGKDGKVYEPYKNSGIQEGDLIKEVNGVKIENTEELANMLNCSEGRVLDIKYQNNNDDFETKITPVITKEDKYMIGLWVRDAACGIGTLTYYNKENNSFGTLGHGLVDVDTGKLLNVKNGDIVTSKIVSIVKGERNKAGEIRGIIDDGIKIGEIEKNTMIGVYGIVTNEEYINKIILPEVSVASRNEIKIGKAKAICQLENEKEPEEYEIEIKKIYKANSKDNKSMLIKITDKELINKTGGIIPGMSGTPIIQNGKFIGAITNVLVSNPEVGFAIFADLMLDNK